MSYADLDIKSTSKFLRIENGTPHDLRILNESPFERLTHWIKDKSVECTGDSCGYCENGEEQTQKYSVNVFDQGLQKVMIWEHTAAVAKILKKIEKTLKEEGKTLQDVDLKVETEGDRLTKKHTITPRMTSKALPLNLKLHALDGDLPF